MRTVAGVIVGYIAMAAVVFGLLTAAFLALGADGAFQPGTYDVSTTWLAVWFVVSVLAGFVGGWVARMVAQKKQVGYWFAAIVLLLGVVSGMMEVGKTVPGPRTGTVDNFEAMNKAQQPSWVVWVTPILGAVSVVIGARRKSDAAEPAA